MSSPSIPATFSGYKIPKGTGFDSLTLVKDQKTPTPGRGEVLIQVFAVSLNYRDLIIAKGTYGGIKPDVVPCSDGAGRVIAVGEGVKDWKVGDRVMGQFTQSLISGHFDQDYHIWQTLGGAIDGMLTELKILPDYGLVRIPEHLSFEEAATLPCAALTAWNALYGTSGNIQLLPGQTVVLQGTGGVSVFGAALAVQAGARAVITSSSDDKLQKVVDHIQKSKNGGGAGELVTHNYKADPDWDKTVQKVTNGNGAEHILEVGGVGTVEKSFNAVRRGGVISTIGFVGSKPDDVPPNIAQLALRKGAVFRGMLVGSRRQFEQMCDAISISKIRPLISAVYNFEDAKKAYQAQWDQSIVGKVVIRVSKQDGQPKL